MGHNTDIEQDYYNPSDETNKIPFKNGGAFVKKISGTGSGYGSIAVVNDSPTQPCWRFGCVPAWFRSEIVLVIKLAWPMALTSLFTFLMAPISLIFCGRLGTEILGGVALANTIINVLGIAVGMGLGTALDTLVSNTYGSNNKMLIGTYVQRGAIILSLSVIPCWVIHLNITPLLVLIGQDRTVSIIAGDYVLFFLPGLLFNYIYQVQCKYLYNQDIIFPTIGFGVVGTIVNVVAHALLVIVWEFGADGSAIAQVAAYFSMVASAFVYIYWSKLYKDSWGGWSMDCLHDWGSFCSLAIPGMMMLFVEWGSFEVGTILTGLLSVIELDAQTIVFQVEGMVFMIPLGFSIAANIRVGQYLGSGDGLAAKRTGQACTIAVCFTAMVVSILLATLRLELPKIFTDESEVIQTAGNILPILAGYMIFDSLAAVNAGILRGCGRQKIGAFFIIIGYIVIGLPIGISLMFATSLRAQGIWLGLTCGIAVEATSFVALFICTNWEDQVRMAQERAGLEDTVPPLPDLHDDEILILSDGSHTDYTSTDEKTALISEPDVRSKRRHRRSRRRRRISLSGPRTTSQHDLSANFPDDVFRPTRLTSKEVIFRRSITVMLLLMLLAVGIYMRFVFAIERCIPLPPNFNESMIIDTRDEMLIPYCNSTLIRVITTTSPL